jgi:hypothetical protein
MSCRSQRRIDSGLKDARARARDTNVPGLSSANVRANAAFFACLLVLFLAATSALASPSGTVPNVRGDSYLAAAKALTRNHFCIAVRLLVTARTHGPIVLRQNPQPGRPAKPWSVVVIVVPLVSLPALVTSPPARCPRLVPRVITH